MYKPESFDIVVESTEQATNGEKNNRQAPRDYDHRDRQAKGNAQTNNCYREPKGK